MLQAMVCPPGAWCLGLLPCVSSPWVLYGSLVLACNYSVFVPSIDTTLSVAMQAVGIRTLFALGTAVGGAQLPWSLQDSVDWVFSQMRSTGTGSSSSSNSHARNNSSNTMPSEVSGREAFVMKVRPYEVVLSSVSI